MRIYPVHSGSISPAADFHCDFLRHLEVIGQRREAVPIGYNKDKRRNLVIARGFGFVLILFPLKRPLKTGFEIGGDNRECYIKDKNIWEILEGILWHTILK